MMAENLDLAPPPSLPWDTEPVIANRSSNVTAIMVIRACKALGNHEKFEDTPAAFYYGSLLPGEQMYVRKRVYDELGMLWNEGDNTFEPAPASAA